MDNLFKEFFNEFNGEPVEVFDPSNYAQCFDLALKWCMWLGLPIDTFAGLMYAKDIWSPSTRIAADNFEFILNTKDAFVQPGDMVVFGTGVGRAGHVSIASKHINQNTFESFDENWPVGSYCKLVTHSYDHVLGWLRFKKPIINSNTSMSEQDKKDIESMRKLREFNGVWYESQNVIEDFKKLKEARELENKNAVKAYKIQEDLYNVQLELNDTLRVANRELLAEMSKLCQPKTYTVQFAAMLVDLANIVESKYKK